ncbi:MAG: hypothetical protein QOE70_4089 [Chthoniobacter sp.]|nr:hypothetical protein [Chthoniobacter sp.]
MRSILAVFLFWHCLSVATRAADPRQAIAAFSSLGSITLEKLATGTIAIESNTSMQLARGISSQACYFVAAPVEQVREFLPTWDGKVHPELEILDHRDFQNEQEAAALRFDEKLPPIVQLMNEMRKPESLQLTRQERAQLPATLSTETAQAYWDAILRARWRNFAASGLKPNSGGFDVRNELKTLLAEEPKAAAHFAALLAETPITKDSPCFPVNCYWSLSNVNKIAAVSLGAIYRKDNQIADLEFYVSSGYLTALTLYELYPIEAGGKTGTLVWQGNFASSDLLAGAFGLKRKIAGRAMEGDALQKIRLFQKDATRP